MDRSGFSPFLRCVLTAALAAALLWVALKFLLPVLAPFILAFLTAAVCEPVVKYLSGRCNMRRGIASALCVLTVLLSLVGFVLLVLFRLFDEAVGLLNELPEMTSGLPALFEKIDRAARRFIVSFPQGVRDYLNDAIAATGEALLALPGSLSAAALGYLGSMAERAPGTVLALVTYAIGSFFISASYDKIISFLRRQIPERFQKRMADLRPELTEGLGQWLRAELTLMAITFAILTAAFALMGVEYGAVIALITAFIDALPVLGSGVVLIPWALVLLLGGDTGRALGLFMTYLVALLARSCLEPKLLGDRFGVEPAAALLAMYAGFKLAGVTGMVLFPIVLMLLGHLNRKGYIRLWK